MTTQDEPKMDESKINESKVDEPAHTEQGLARLERQMERGSLFTHTAVSQNADRIQEAESFVYGLVDALIDKGLLTEAEVAQAAAKVRREIQTTGQAIGPAIALRVDGESADEEPFIAVNCAERLAVCKAVCCRLHFALSAEEVEAGIVKWDLGAPYYIRHEAYGCCHHLNAESKGCSVYRDRPNVCRRYSCARDQRIWKDFDNMVLNEEWIDQHLGGSRPRLVSAGMQLRTEED